MPQRGSPPPAWEIRTTAVRGDDYVLNGAKTFLTGGSQADRIVVVAHTSRDESDRRRGPSLLVLDTTSPGFGVGRRLDKIGMKSRDTCELSA